MPPRSRAVWTLLAFLAGLTGMVGFGAGWLDGILVPFWSAVVPAASLVALLRAPIHRDTAGRPTRHLSWLDALPGRWRRWVLDERPLR